MNSIRPLITITILVVAFAFLYVKINQSPVRPAADDAKAWEPPADGIPPLADTTTDPSSPSAETPAPAAQVDVTSATEVSASASAPAANESLPAVAEVTETTPAAVPDVPEMPELATTTQAAAPATTSADAPIDLPANVPTARYPDQPATSVGETPVDVSANAAQPIADIASTTPITPATPESVNAATAAAPEPAPPLTSQANPLRQAVQPMPDIPAAPAISADASFVASWPTIQAALDRGELATAHQLLSRWYDDPSLTPTDAERVDSLLSQLAGTVVYSTEHQLAPAHVVKPGETLETIGKTYNVPWQLLAKINGVAAADQLRLGQELKVVPGPFSATVDLTRNQMTLMVDGRYAGKFSVTPSSSFDIPAGEWYVQTKVPAAQIGNVHAMSLASNDHRNVHISVIGTAASDQLPQENSPRLTVTSADAAELADILSIGSRVVIRR